MAYPTMASASADQADQTGLARRGQDDVVRVGECETRQPVDRRRHAFDGVRPWAGPDQRRRR